MAATVWNAENAVERAELAGAIRFAQAFHEDDLRLGMYAPRGDDPQQPHTQDELYFVIRGTGRFVNGNRIESFGPGDAIFVPAGVLHRFEDFSDDFATWVVFWGSEGGEAAPPWPADADPGEPWLWSASTADQNPTFAHGSMRLRHGRVRSAIEEGILVLTVGNAKFDGDDDGRVSEAGGLVLVRGGNDCEASGDAMAWMVSFAAAP